MKTSTTFADESTEILRVTTDGGFFWHKNADQLISAGDIAPSMGHILRALRASRPHREMLSKRLTDEERVALGVAVYSDIVSDGGMDPRNAQPQQEPVAGKGKELSEQLKLCARNVAFVAAGRVDMSSAAMQEMFALIDHVCVGLDSPPGREPLTDEPTYTEQQIANACWAAEISDSKCESLLIALQEAAHGIKEKE